MTTIRQLQKEAHDNAVKHGFYDDASALEDFLKGCDTAPKALSMLSRRSFTLEQLAKFACEVGEAVDAIQRGGVYSERVKHEMADIVIRVADLAGYLGFDLEQSIEEKMATNRARPYKHGKLC